MNPQVNKTVIVTNIAAWLKNRYILRNSYYIESADGRFYVINGVRIAANEFESLYPLELENIA